VWCSELSTCRGWVKGGGCGKKYYSRSGGSREVHDTWAMKVKSCGGGRVNTLKAVPERLVGREVCGFEYENISLLRSVPVTTSPLGVVSLVGSVAEVS
jgi:hypothetical protein